MSEKKLLGVNHEVFYVGSIDNVLRRENESQWAGHKQKWKKHIHDTTLNDFMLEKKLNNKSPYIYHCQPQISKPLFTNAPVRTGAKHRQHGQYMVDAVNTKASPSSLS